MATLEAIEGDVTLGRFQARTFASQRVLGPVVSVLLLGLLVQSCASTTPGPSTTIRQYLAAWSRGDYRSMRTMVLDPPATFVSFNKNVASTLGLLRASFASGTPKVEGSQATVRVTGSLVLAGFGPWRVRRTLTLTDTQGQWLVAWSPGTVLPKLGLHDSVSVNVSWPERAPILGAGGAPLTVSAPMVTVGIEGSRITDPTALTSALEQAGATSAQVSSALATAMAHPQWFVSVLDLPQSTYEQLKPIIYPVPGTVFQTSSALSAITPGLAAHVVGTVGPITAQELHTLGSPYQANDLVGQSGIEQTADRQLAGTPGGTITIQDRSGHTIATVARFAPHPGTPVQTTIDPSVQQAAESALNGVTQPAALVALQASTGDVLASVSLPNSSQFDISLAGTFPPGSTFKVVTSADLIEHGLTPSSQASCPPTITVGGETFHNFEGETQSSLTLEQAFAESCNAAFIGLAGNLPPASFPTVASQFGIGATLHIGLSSFGGSVPTPSSDADKAATAIGQARVLVSPLVMATAAAAVDSGSLHLPRLVVGAPGAQTSPQPLSATVVADLRTMMGAVVTAPDGTAAGAGLPTGTFGKTGTAEFGTATPPQTHAWFIGYRGDVAFAVLVVGGGVGGAVAAPIAARFLNALGSA
jgi:cell division protein FtsI/penicillin-binding protein 2